jgi:MFS family permease
MVSSPISQEPSAKLIGDQITRLFHSYLGASLLQTSNMATETARNLNESTATPAASEAVLLILVTASFSHLLNDTIQSLIPAIYPVLKDSFQLSFAQIGLVTLTFQVTASLLQPLVGLYTDHRPQPFSLTIGMAFSLVGLVLLAFANSYPMILVAAASVGLGSSIFHPEASRLARSAHRIFGRLRQNHSARENSGWLIAAPFK